MKVVEIHKEASEIIAIKDLQERTDKRWRNETIMKRKEEAKRLLAIRNRATEFMARTAIK